MKTNVIRVTLVIHKVNMFSKNNLLKQNFNFLSQKQKVEIMYSRETKTSISELDIKEIKITAMLT